MRIENRNENTSSGAFPVPASNSFRFESHFPGGRVGREMKVEVRDWGAGPAAPE